MLYSELIETDAADDNNDLVKEKLNETILSLLKDYQRMKKEDTEGEKEPYDKF